MDVVVLFGDVSRYAGTLGTKGCVGVIKPLVGVGDKQPSGNQRVITFIRTLGCLPALNRNS